MEIRYYKDKKLLGMSVFKAIWNFIKKIFGFGFNPSKSQKTPLGMDVFYSSELSKEYLAEEDKHYEWIARKGFPIPANQITIYIHDGFLDPKNNAYWFKDSWGRQVAGYVATIIPSIIIHACKQTQPVLRHELMHIFCWKMTGDLDINHTGDCWKDMEIYG